MITLHPQLEKDCYKLGRFKLCTLLLMNDSNYPWFILLPNRENTSEIYQLSQPDQQQLLAESVYFSHCLQQVFHADKLNIAALGNIVPQLHIHHIVRYRSDACWPAPVWGAVPAITYKEGQLTNINTLLSDCFAGKPEQPFHWF